MLEKVNQYWWKEEFDGRSGLIQCPRSRRWKFSTFHPKHFDQYIASTDNEVHQVAVGLHLRVILCKLQKLMLSVWCWSDPLGFAQPQLQEYTPDKQVSMIYSKDHWPQLGILECRVKSTEMRCVEMLSCYGSFLCFFSWSFLISFSFFRKRLYSLVSALYT